MTRLEAVEMLTKGYEKLQRFDYEQFDIAIQALMLCDKPEDGKNYMTQYDEDLKWFLELVDGLLHITGITLSKEGRERLERLKNGKHLSGSRKIRQKLQGGHG